ncbi:MAG: hypothetical protein KGK01_01225 [Bradyrhizobium sp.]|uniref:hypothetical protein n=1 Tax=Bradyrhizobium sp. TaxID=376 RepID=UPI001C287B97|nr:hypothetical protein [Bradyrhizobium sp.]MBU6463950.1 hypothetical protein [Pseudomonadota bacterium]MDE2067505.1 hypothetical protein [Bradyrhizobium sp.]MDE2241087.1 hypothetical protein [Bradyrhizobium sp.]MDE2471391.1 hypothetical protein [Bradyrhizobium sp.]
MSNDVDQWEWGCGFYPGTDPGEGSGGIAATFEAARADFEAARRTFRPARTEADYQAWRNIATGQRGNMPCGMPA